MRLPVGTQVAALNGTGTPKSDVPCHVKDGMLEFALDPAAETLWYAVTP